MVAVTSYHKLDGRNQHNVLFYISHDQKSKIRFTGLNSMCQHSWLQFLLVVLDENLFPCLFQLLEAIYIFGLCPIFRVLQRNRTNGIYRQYPPYGGLTYSFSTWQCSESSIHLREAVLQKLNFDLSWAIDTQFGTLLWCWAVAVSQNTQSGMPSFNDW